MKALQDRGVAKEGVITRLHKCVKILTDEQEKYKGVVCALNQEVKDLRGNWRRRVVRKRKNKKLR